MLGRSLDTHDYFPDHDQWDNPHLRFFTHDGFHRFVRLGGFQVIDDRSAQITAFPLPGAAAAGAFRNRAPTHRAQVSGAVRRGSLPGRAKAWLMASGVQSAARDVDCSEAPTGVAHDRIKRAIVTTSDTIGGHEMQLVHLARATGGLDDTVLVAMSEASAQYFSEAGFDVRLAPFYVQGKIWSQWLAARRLGEVLRPHVEGVAEVIVSGGTIEACVAPARALKLLAPDRAVTAYVPMYIDRTATYGPLGAVYNPGVLAFIGAIDRFITINRIQARLLARNYRRPVRVLRNTITPLPVPTEDFGQRLIMIGRLDDRQKNVTGAIDLLDDPGNPFATLHLFGDGPDRTLVEARGRQARHIEVVLHGWASHARIAAELGRGDVLVMNSRWEGEPMIVRELATTGIPVVGNNIAGLRGVVPRRLRFNDRSELLAILRRLHAEREPDPDFG